MIFHSKLNNGGSAKAAAAGLAMAFGLACAPAAHAAQYFLQSFTIDRSNVARISGPSGSGFTAVSLYMAPHEFTANKGTSASGDTFNLTAFCLDIFHYVRSGDRNLRYDDEHDLETNSNFSGQAGTFLGATVLSNDQIDHVGRLVNFGTALYASSDADRINKLAAVQGAIWKVINPTYTIDARNNAVDVLISQYAQPAFGSNHSAAFKMITETGQYGGTAARQGFGVAVPEPATWAMMILGFGGVGAVLRSRRRFAFA